MPCSSCSFDQPVVAEDETCLLPMHGSLCQSHPTHNVSLIASADVDLGHLQRAALLAESPAGVEIAFYVCQPSFPS